MILALFFLNFRNEKRVLVFTDNELPRCRAAVESVAVWPALPTSLLYRQDSDHPEEISTTFQLGSEVHSLTISTADYHVISHTSVIQKE